MVRNWTTRLTAATGVLALCLAALVPAQVRAQTSVVELEPEPEWQCMTPAASGRGSPVYPSRELQMREGADVKVLLSFESPDAAPKVKVLAPIPAESFVDAVKAHVSSYRVPCKARGTKPFELALTFAFDPADSLRAIAGQRPSKSCLVKGDDPLSYPSEALGQEREGLIITRVTFVAPDQAPEVTILNPVGFRPFSASVRKSMSAWRLPCLEPGQVASFRTINIFRISGSSRARLKDMELTQFLPMVKGIQTQKVKFDFNEIGCPFNMVFALRQPYMENAVAMRLPARPAGSAPHSLDDLNAFHIWMRSLDLDVPPDLREQVMAHESVIHVPCIKLDL